MLKIYREIFDDLNDNISYAVWKGVHELSKALQGDSDIDLLVDIGKKDLFQRSLHRRGFLNASYPFLKYPFIEHWYGYDEASGKICHLHIYYKIITGESHLKSYHISMESEVLRDRIKNEKNVYIASYPNQAIIYTLRHYMKRSSFVGLFLWFYEREGYLKEYACIRDGLSALEKSGANLENLFHVGIDFNRLDFKLSIFDFINTRKTLNISKVSRRYGSTRAALESLRYVALRIYIKLFRVKKSLSSGAILALSGTDGAGKSSMVRELDSFLGQHFATRRFHLGTPIPTCLTWPLRPFLAILRKSKTKAQNKGYQQFSLDKEKAGGNSLLWALRYSILAYERYQSSRNAAAVSLHGAIAICDRYPSLSFNKMDSPRIASGGSMIVQKMRQFETQLYRNMAHADCLIYLGVSPETAIARNRMRSKNNKETDSLIAQRHKENKHLAFCANRIVHVDADGPFPSVLKAIKKIAWDSLFSQQGINSPHMR
jgi:thymidylate kinase